MLPRQPRARGVCTAMTVSLQEQARALGDPTRHDIFRYVADSDEPVDVRRPVLTADFGSNHNAIRQHLASSSKPNLSKNNNTQLSPGST